jgi:hypothetical protein
MENIAYCPYRVNINGKWTNVQTTQFTPPVTFSGSLQTSQLTALQTTQLTALQTTQFTAPMTFTGTAKDLDLLEACREKPETADPNSSE